VSQVFGCGGGGGVGVMLVCGGVVSLFVVGSQKVGVVGVIGVGSGVVGCWTKLVNSTRY